MHTIQTFCTKIIGGKYQVIEVKGVKWVNKINDINVRAKADAARESVTESEIMKKNVLD